MLLVNNYEVVGHIKHIFVIFLGSVAPEYLHK